MFYGRFVPLGRQEQTCSTVDSCRYNVKNERSFYARRKASRSRSLLERRYSQVAKCKNELMFVLRSFWCSEFSSSGSQLVSCCFEPSQPHRDISGLINVRTNFLTVLKRRREREGKVESSLFLSRSPF